jgi:hypothetical protein
MEFNMAIQPIDTLKDTEKILKVPRSGTFKIFLSSALNAITVIYNRALPFYKLV